MLARIYQYLHCLFALITLEKLLLPHGPNGSNAQSKLRPKPLPVAPHNSNPRTASAAARLKQQLAATSAAGAFDADSNGSDATAE